MNIHEHQAKALLKTYGLPVAEECVSSVTAKRTKSKRIGTKNTKRNDGLFVTFVPI